MNWTKNLRYDLPASIVVFFVAVPLCLGIAKTSDAPLFSGLIAGIIGGLLVGAISRSPLGVSGPAAGLAVIVAAAVKDLGLPAFFAATALAGVIQLALGFARAGTLGYFFPSAVIKGMLAGIGLLIFLKNIPHFLGYDKDAVGDLAREQVDGETTFSGIVNAFQHPDWSAFFVAAASLLILLVWDGPLRKTGNKLFQIVQGPLVAVAFGIAYQVATSKWAPEYSLAGNHLVSVPVPESVDDFLGIFQFPDWSALANFKVWIAAFTIAIVASIETLLCVSASDRMDPLKRLTPTNRELVAQGVGNFSSGLIGGLPVTQVIVRSSTNVQSGGRTKASAILHGGWILLFVVVLPDILNLVPIAVLASILLVVGYKLAKPALFADMWKLGMSQFLPFVVTIVGIVMTDLLMGIGIGLAVAILVILRRNFMNSHFLHIEEVDSETGRHLVQMRLSEEVTFLNKGAIMKELNRVPDGSVVQIDTSKCIVADYDVLEVIEDFKSNASNRGIEVRVIDDSAVSQSA